MTYLLLGLFGGFVGVLSGLLGIGGGILLVPGLIYLFGFTQPEAQGTSLAVLIPPIGIFAALVYYQNGYIRFPVVGVVALGFVLGAFAGAKFVPYVPLSWLRLGFGGLLLWTGWLFIIKPAHGRSSAMLSTGFAAFVTLLLGLFVRRTRTRLPPPPPGEELEYHI